MLDVHSHILPAIDDGVKTIEDGLTVVRGLSQLGFTHSVATPHFYPGRHTPSAEKVIEAASLLKEAMRKESIPLEIILGRECLLDYELLTAPDKDTFPFTWKGALYQLIELPQISIPKAASTYLESLRSKNIQPILAHAERYNRIIRDPQRVQEYIDMGFRIQVDLISFCKATHKAVRAAALSLLESDQIDLVASDIHRPSQLESVGEAVEFLRDKCGSQRAATFYELP